MTKQEAINILEQISNAIQTNREGHKKIEAALRLVQEELGVKPMLLDGPQKKATQKEAPASTKQQG